MTLVSTRPVAPGPVDPDLDDHSPALMEQLFGRPEPDWTDRDSVVEAARLAARRAAQRWSGKKPQVKVLLTED